ncbi:restriction endonuclease subunit S [Marinobacter sp.]|uniref:restriction endonuclease subunit S n=1 Tax=Marinobacter sp. TaxID=50741 RepID=UPI002B264874|nr:restriction endonuclease subunit S [Marinobacter sp.]
MSLLQIPELWQSEALENLLAHVIGGDWGKVPDHQEEGYQCVACIRGSEFRNWARDSGRTAVVRKVKENSLEKRSLLPGDILLEISGGGPDQPVGRTVLINQSVLDQFDTPVIGTNFLRLLRPSASINQRYLNRYLEFFYSSGEVVRYQGGSNNLRNLKFKEYSQISVPIPSPAEQKVIADKLDTLLAQVENTKARLERIPQILKHFRQSVLAAAVSGRLTEEWRGSHDYRCLALGLEKSDEVTSCPREWQTMTLADACNVVSGNAFKSNEFTDTGTTPAIKISNVQYGAFEKKNQQYLPGSHLQTYRKFEVLPGDLLMALTRPITNDTLKVCRYPITEPAGLLNQRVAKFLFNNEQQKEFFELLFQSNYFKLQVYDKLSETLQPNLSPVDLKKFLVSLPSSEEQTEIVRRVDQLFAHANHIEQQVNNALARVNNLTQSILAKAFRGELTEQWRNDNPELTSGENSAGALLERIKTERAKTKPEKQRRRTTRA